MNISLPDQMRDFVQQRVESGEFANASDYVRDLIRRDRGRVARQEVLLTELRAGRLAAERGETSDLEEAFDDALRLIETAKNGNL